MSIHESTDNQITQFLTFELAGEAYGVEILKVREIRGWEPVRKLPDTPDFIKGALNLRGSIVPIVDLRERFNMPPVEYSPMTVVIVLSVQPVEAGGTVMGIIADAVSDVLDVNPADIKQTPNLGSKINTCYMRGMYVRESGMVLLLDVDRLLNPEEFANMPGLR